MTDRIITTSAGSPTRPPARTAPASAAVGPDDGHRGVVGRWPLTWGDLGWFALAYAALTAAFVGIGALVTGPLDGSVGEFDRDLADELAAGRTAGLDDVSYWASMLAETGVKIVLTVVVVAVMLAVWRRWEDPLLVATALILEASVFITVTWIVGRGRPDVVRLDASPVDSSFPSGHVAAAVVYGAVAIVVARHVRRTWPTVVALLVTVAVSVAVAWSRMYRGMHHLSDVVAGIALGLASLAATWWILRGAGQRGAGQRGAGDRGAEARAGLEP